TTGRRTNLRPACAAENAMIRRRGRDRPRPRPDGDPRAPLAYREAAHAVAEHALGRRLVSAPAASARLAALLGPPTGGAAPAGEAPCADAFWSFAERVSPLVLALGERRAMGLPADALENDLEGLLTAWGVGEQRLPCPSPELRERWTRDAIAAL